METLNDNNEENNISNEALKLKENWSDLIGELQEN